MVFQSFLVRRSFDDTKGAIWIQKSKKERQHNGQKKKDKMTNIDLQNITHKTKDRVIRTPSKVSWAHNYMSTFLFRLSPLSLYWPSSKISECITTRQYKSTMEWLPRSIFYIISYVIIMFYHRQQDPSFGGESLILIFNCI